jgi:hypothetical protein
LVAVGPVERGRGKVIARVWTKTVSIRRELTCMVQNLDRGEKHSADVPLN